MTAALAVEIIFLLLLFATVVVHASEELLSSSSSHGVRKTSPPRSSAVVAWAAGAAAAAAAAAEQDGQRRRSLHEGRRPQNDDWNMAMSSFDFEFTLRMNITEEYPSRDFALSTMNAYVGENLAETAEKRRAPLSIESILSSVLGDCDDTSALLSSSSSSSSMYYYEDCFRGNTTIKTSWSHPRLQPELVEKILLADVRTLIADEFGSKHDDGAGRTTNVNSTTTSTTTATTTTTTTPGILVTYEFPIIVASSAIVTLRGVTGTMRPGENEEVELFESLFVQHFTPIMENPNGPVIDDDSKQTTTSTTPPVQVTKAKVLFQGAFFSAATAPAAATGDHGGGVQHVPGQDQRRHQEREGGHDGSIEETTGGGGGGDRAARLLRGKIRPDIFFNTQASDAAGAASQGQEEDAVPSNRLDLFVEGVCSGSDSCTERNLEEILLDKVADGQGSFAALLRKEGNAAGLSYFDNLVSVETEEDDPRANNFDSSSEKMNDNGNVTTPFDHDHDVDDDDFFLFLGKPDNIPGWLGIVQREIPGWLGVAVAFDVILILLALVYLLLFRVCMRPNGALPGGNKKQQQHRDSWLDEERKGGGQSERFSSRRSFTESSTTHRHSEEFLPLNPASSPKRERRLVRPNSSSVRSSSSMSVRSSSLQSRQELGLKRNQSAAGRMMINQHHQSSNASSARLQQPPPSPKRGQGRDDQHQRPPPSSPGGKNSRAAVVPSSPSSGSKGTGGRLEDFLSDPNKKNAPAVSNSGIGQQGEEKKQREQQQQQQRPDWDDVSDYHTIDDLTCHVKTTTENSSSGKVGSGHFA